MRTFHYLSHPVSSTLLWAWYRCAVLGGPALNSGEDVRQEMVCVSRWLLHGWQVGRKVGTYEHPKHQPFHVQFPMWSWHDTEGQEIHLEGCLKNTFSGVLFKAALERSSFLFHLLSGRRNSSDQIQRLFSIFNLRERGAILRLSYVETHIWVAMPTFFIIVTLVPSTVPGTELFKKCLWNR